jgi:acetyl-CoA carboxylase carboxyl transferase subunit alpha
VVDEIVPEPQGGAHRRKAEAIASAGDALERALDNLRGMDGHQLKAMRREKFLSMGREPGIH